MKRTAGSIAAVIGAAVVAVGTGGCGAESGDAGASGVNVRSGIPDTAARFEVRSADIGAGEAIPRGFWANAFGCSEAGRAPRIEWSGVPEGARSFAVTMFDRDAPTGSGFWHWLNWDIPVQAREFGGGAVGVAGTNDAGATGYLGPCPPAGDRAHEYVITVVALDTASLELPASTPPAVATFTMNSHVIGYGQLTARARR
ncbi:YbhB/YbcL family Raf kinase inhibitor-like protein [Nocardia yamanashiensis]|uniref:YbhB/YbcL family Raf kinase inhibitor-like protein n=1 Tax=Nocardia yamanashiensis TaxID=209247 RepID=UPI001E3A9D6A|nr:YbhB/YbcL family Raf kinase inhibitor-like protein [Nocardia yamanashiensis]UGT41360.1 YbhB/YbcL family Raf kinase inhibitor-like protein [Nocardia yamanashiensis]